MKAVVWHGKRDVRVETVPDPQIEEPTDAIVRITSTGLCGSDLHLYELLTPFMTEGDILGHESMGIVEEVGSQVRNIVPGDRVVVPFNISCGHCFMCSTGLQSQCETTQVHDYERGAALFGYTKMYGQVSRRPGRAAAGAAGPPRADQGAPRSPRRSLRPALRRVPDGVAGRAVRRRPARLIRRRPRSRSDRADVLPHRPPPRHRAGDRRGPRPGATGTGPSARRRRARPVRLRRRPAADR